MSLCGVLIGVRRNAFGSTIDVLPPMVNPTDVVQDAELGGLVGLFGGGALEVGIGDVVSEAADDRFGVCGRDNPAPTVIGVRGFEDWSVEAGEFKMKGLGGFSLR